MTHAIQTKPIIEPGRNCWVQEEAESAGLLIDGRDYYRAFYQAAQKAQRRILIAGWRFNSDVRLIRGPDAQEWKRSKVLTLLEQTV